MITFLKPNERLICAGMTAFRAPDGKPLEAAPQYIIVPADKADVARTVELRGNERLIAAGTIHSDRKAAEDRYAEALAGRAKPRADA